MRGQLPAKIIEDIDKQLPRLDELWLLVTLNSIKINMADLKNNTLLHVALVCLEDACHLYNHIRVSLFEAIACKCWYMEFSEKQTEDKEITAISSSKYYLDYASLLLYATAEDLADFIIYFLNINKDLEEFVNQNKALFEKKNVNSKAGKAGIFLEQKRPDHELTKIIQRLHSDNNWQKALNYRNRWVNEKPPIIKGLGIDQNRKNRIIKNGNKKSIGIGGGSRHDFTINELHDFINKAAGSFAECINSIIEFVIRKREESGDKFDFNENKINCRNIFG
jgi:hypothetical protein